MQLHFLPSKSWPQITKGKFLLCFPSTGNLGQLVADLLIYNYQGDRLGYFEDESIIPFASTNPYNSDDHDIYFAAECKSFNINPND